VVDTDKLFSVIDFYRSNMDRNAEEWNWNEQQAAFAEGKAAMMVQGLWSYGAAIGTNPKLNCGLVPFPVFNDAKLNKFYAERDNLAKADPGFAPMARDFVGMQVKGINANPTIPVHAGLAKFLKEKKAWNEKWKIAGK